MSDLKTIVSKCNTVLFDMDGTIVNTEPLHAKSAALVLKSMGIEIDLMSCLEKYYGMTDTMVLEMECPQLSDVEIEIAIKNKNLKLIELFSTLAPEEKNKYITPGLFEFLNYLKLEKKNIAVVSASEDIIVTETLKCFGITHLIPLQMGRGQTVKTKPNPDPYIEAMKRLNTKPESTLIFEDSPTGLTAAKSSGAQVIRITGFAHDDKKSEFFELRDFLTL